MRFWAKIVTIILFFIFVFQNSVFSIEEISNDELNNGVDLEQQETNEQAPKLVSAISYDDVLKKANDHSYDLKIADFNILISKQDVRYARSEYFPKLNAMAGTEYTKNFRDIKESTVMSIGEAFINPYTRYQSIFGITLNYNLFDFGVRKGRMDIAKEDVKLKELQEKEARQELNLNVLDTYSKILVAAKQIDLNSKILELEEKNLEYRTRLYEAKEISSNDYDDSKARVENARKKIFELYGIMTESLNWLSFYTGEQYSGDEMSVDEFERPDFDVMKFTDYTKSITWQIHEKELKKKELEVKVAKRNYLPKVNAYGRYYLYGSDHSSYPDAIKGIEPSNITVGGNIVMPVFDGFQNSATVRRAELEYQQLQIERDKAIAQLMTRLATMRSNLVYLDEQVQSSNEIIKELTNKVKSTQRLANKKVATPIELNEANIELLEQTIELEKNKITSVATVKAIQILSEEEQ